MKRPKRKERLCIEANERTDRNASGQRGTGAAVKSSLTLSRTGTRRGAERAVAADWARQHRNGACRTVETGRTRSSQGRLAHRAVIVVGHEQRVAAPRHHRRHPKHDLRTDTINNTLGARARHRLDRTGGQSNHAQRVIGTIGHKHIARVVGHRVSRTIHQCIDAGSVSETTSARCAADKRGDDGGRYVDLAHTAS